MDRRSSRQTAAQHRATVSASGRTGTDVPATEAPSERHSARRDGVTSVTDVIRHLLR